MTLVMRMIYAMWLSDEMIYSLFNYRVHAAAGFTAYVINATTSASATDARLAG